MLDPVERIANLLAGLHQHQETVGIEYVKACDEIGEAAMIKGLVAKGYQESFLKCLGEVGKGLADPRLLLLSPDKRLVLQCVDMKTQRDILSNGVNGVPIDKIKPDVFKQKVLKQGEKRKSKRTDKHHVDAHIKSNPGPRKGPKPCSLGIVPDGAGLQEWHKVVDAICEAIEKGEFPASQMERLAQACMGWALD